MVFKQKVVNSWHSPFPPPPPLIISVNTNAEGQSLKNWGNE